MRFRVIHRMLWQLLFKLFNNLLPFHLHWLFDDRCVNCCYCCCYLPDSVRIPSNVNHMRMQSVFCLLHVIHQPISLGPKRNSEAQSASLAERDPIARSLAFFSLSAMRSYILYSIDAVYVFIYFFCCYLCCVYYFVLIRNASARLRFFRWSIHCTQIHTVCNINLYWYGLIADSWLSYYFRFGVIH